MKRLLDHWHRWRRRRRARKITLTGARRRAARGAGYLDEVAPEWYRAVDPQTLELAGGERCVLGQLHGDFRAGLGRARLLNLSSAPRASLSPVAYGFQCMYGVSDALQDRDYHYLNQAWREVIRHRQEADDDGNDDDGNDRCGDSRRDPSGNRDPSKTAVRSRPLYRSPAARPPEQSLPASSLS